MNFKAFYNLFESYSTFRTKQRSEGNDIETINNTIELFKQLKTTGALKDDITQYYNTPIEDVITMLEELERYRSPSDLKRTGDWDVNSFNDPREAELIHDNKHFTTILVKTWEAAKKYGCNTKWCIVPSEHQFNHYGSIYMVLNKKADKHSFARKLAISPDDEHTDMWTADNGEMIYDAPEIQKLFVSIYVEGNVEQLETLKGLEDDEYTLETAPSLQLYLQEIE